jgi:predicted RNase H-like HicB family nuclease
MLTAYIRTAMQQAHYEILEDGTYYGEIPALQGVYANADTLEACREELQGVLEGWIILGLRLGHSLPVLERCHFSGWAAAIFSPLGVNTASTTATMSNAGTSPNRWPA